LREHNYCAAIAAARQMLQHTPAFRFSQRLLGKGGEQIGIGMTFCGFRP
jgi:hypothetical protein